VVLPEPQDSNQPGGPLPKNGFCSRLVRPGQVFATRLPSIELPFGFQERSPNQRADVSRCGDPAGVTAPGCGRPAEFHLQHTGNRPVQAEHCKWPFHVDSANAAQAPADSSRGHWAVAITSSKVCAAAGGPEGGEETAVRHRL